MQILALETSTDAGSCALWRDGAVTARACPAGQPHSETLLPLVRELLGEAGLAVGQLDAIAFGVGPGAFTGLRVACGAAQGLAVAAGLPLVPVGSLETVAAMNGGDRVLALLDARMGEVYYGHYVRGGEGLALRGEIRVAAPADVELPGGAGWQAVGNALAAYPDLAERCRNAGIDVREALVPTATAMLPLAAARLARGEAIDAALAAPLYVRDKVAKTVAERLREGGKA